MNPVCSEHVYLQRLELGSGAGMGWLIWNVKHFIPISTPLVWPWEPCMILLGTWLGWSVLKNETHEQGETATSSLLVQKGAGTPKSARAEQRPLPYLSLTQVMCLSPSHWSGQGAHSSQFADLKQIVTGRRGKEDGGGSQEGETGAK